MRGLRTVANFSHSFAWRFLGKKTKIQAMQHIAQMLCTATAHLPWPATASIPSGCAPSALFEVQEPLRFRTAGGEGLKARCATLALQKTPSRGGQSGLYSPREEWVSCGSHHQAPGAFLAFAATRARAASTRSVVAGESISGHFRTAWWVMPIALAAAMTPPSFLIASCFCMVRSKPQFTTVCQPSFQPPLQSLP